MRTKPSPPPGARRLVAWLLARRDALDALVDLDELYQHKAAEAGVGYARRWYWRQIPSFIWHVRTGRERRARTNVSFLRQDVAYCLRGVAREPRFAAMVVATLAVGIGAATAVGSIVYPILWSPLGYPDESRIVRVWPERHFTQEQFELYYARTRSLEKFSGIVLDTFTLTGDPEPVVLTGAVVTSEHFATFGVAPARGRTFEPGDSAPGSEPVAIVSHELWQSRFGGRNDIVGRRLDLGGRDGAGRTIVGIAPPGFQPLGKPIQVWTPAVFSPDTDAYRDMANMRAVARLAPGATVEAATAELAAIATSLEPPPYYLNEVPTYTVLPFRDALLGDAGPTLVTVLGAVVLVLLLCCSNVTSLLLARNRAREHEIAVRRALGASTARLARQWLTESLVLAVLAGILAVAAVAVLHPTLTALLPASLPRTSSLRPGTALYLIGFAVSLTATCLCGAAPAFRAAASPHLGTRGGTAGRSRVRWNAVLVSFEVALSLALVVACGLLTKSFFKLSRVDVGFPREEIASVRVFPPASRYPDEAARKKYFADVVEAVRQAPSVREAGAITLLPMTPSFMGVGYSPSGASLPEGESPPVASYRVVTPSYRSALGIPLLAGRDLAAGDLTGRRAVGLVNETLARTLLPAEDLDVVGRELRFEDGSSWLTIVGVIGDVHQQRLDRAPIPEVYVPLEQDAWPTAMSIVASTDSELPGFAPSFRDAIWSVDENVPLTEIRSMREVIRLSLATERLRTVVFTSFAALAFVLSAIGVYGVVAYTVSQRTREIGLRMAFGASGAQVVSETLRRNAPPVLYALAGGTLLALLAARGLASFLYEVPTTDASVYGAALALLTSVALLASWIPARRASRIDPLSSLRADD